MPKEAMVELSPEQQAQMLDASRTLHSEVLTDGDQHFVLLGGFACCLAIVH